MSAPDVNIEKQKKRHHSMVKGIWLGAGLALLVVIGVLLSMSLFGAGPSDVIPANATVSD